MASVPAPQSARLEKTGNKVLLVDDDKFLTDLYTMKFTQAGFEARGALSSKEALDILRDGFDPDAVLFDLIMPDGDGFYLVETIRSEHLAARALLVALTNEVSTEEENRIKALGASKYIVKATLIPSEVVNSIMQEVQKKSA